ncbi:MAG: MBL fold metallo-hydrolase [bacterium]|nr:MBL fold metallo-hydrolase [bacterium]
MKEYSLVGCGGVGGPTGANFLLKTPKLSVLVDCGLIQGSHFAMQENETSFPYNPKEISFLFVTHAHMDHIGRIPKLVKDGFSGVIYSTIETRELAVYMLEDAEKLIAREASESHRESIYGREDVFHALSLWKTLPYQTSLDLSDIISVYLKDAGHILGSAIIEINLKEIGKKIVFTGDLGNSPTPLLRDTEIVDSADYMVIESVYGDRNHEPKDVRDAKLHSVLVESLNRGGTVVIPAFSLERTQVILYEINELVEKKKIPRAPIFLDSPLAIKVTSVYRAHTENFNEKVRDIISGGDDIFDFPGLEVVRNPMESEAIHSRVGAKIIIAGSGMSVGGRVLSHELFYLSDPNATILLVGYQVPGSLGRRIEEHALNVSINGQNISVRAHIEKISGFSSHKDSNGLVDFVSHSAKTLKKVFVAMGENKSATFLAQRLCDELDVDAIVQEKGREYKL